MTRAGYKQDRAAAERKTYSTVTRQMPGVIFLCMLLILWQVLSQAIGKPYLLPSPLSVLESLWENRREIFLVHLPATMEVVAIGGVLAVLSGSLFAILMDWFPWLKRALYPILTWTQTIPVMCIAPAFVLWFGYTVKMRVIVVILVNFFTVTVNLYDGFASVRPERIELMRTYGADRLQIFSMLKMPTALPYFFTALRISIPWSVIGAAVAEWLGAQNGLGTYSRSCMMNLDAAGLLAPLLVLTAFALLMNALLGMIERRVLYWQE
ncbi:MAG: ABC transporter permease [Lachnospiraceae bacterium]|nr:ABC transporter permease [Lachnospiraceae bacterium]